jgi:hypothetical protein
MKSVADTPFRFVFKRGREIIIKKWELLLLLFPVYIAEIFILFSAHGLFWEIILK